MLALDGRDLLFTALSIACLLASALLLLLSQVVPPNDAVCVAKSSVFSPLLEAVQYDFVNFGDHYHHSKFRGKSTPLSEQVWKEFLDGNLIKFPIDRVQSLQIDAPLDTQWKRYNDEYLAAVPAFVQQLNCLSLLRKYTHYDLAGSERTRLRKGADSCLELIRLSLTCKGDVTPFLIWKSPEHLTDGPDLDIMHKCRNFEALRDAAKLQSAGTSRLYKIADF